MENLLHRIAEGIVRGRKTFVLYASVFLVFPLFLYLEAGQSFISWLIAYMMLLSCVKLINNIIDDKEYFKSVTIISFVILSLYGLIITYDNITNFGVPFGSRHDDSDFFYTIKGITEGSDVEIEVWFFEYTYSFIAIVIRSLQFLNDFKLFDLLPINWAFAALCVGLSSEIAYKISNQRLPYWLLFIVLLGNHVFVKTTVHLYRDGFMLFFALLAILCYTSKEFHLVS